MLNEEVIYLEVLQEYMLTESVTRLTEKSTPDSGLLRCCFQLTRPVLPSFILMCECRFEREVL